MTEPTWSGGRTICLLLNSSVCNGRDFAINVSPLKLEGPLFLKACSMYDSALRLSQGELLAIVEVLSRLPMISDDAASASSLLLVSREEGLPEARLSTLLPYLLSMSLHIRSKAFSL